ncbi:MAG: ASCH domain-containing protein [bacterium]
MEHLAIMRKSFGLLPKILSGEKTIESHWYKNKYSPWNKIKRGERIYFKNSGEPATIKAEVAKVVQYNSLKPAEVKEILLKYGKKDGLGIDELAKFYQMFKNKKYCLLVFLKNPKRIKPFEINKKGYGNMASWIATDDINKLKKSLT